MPADIDKILKTLIDQVYIKRNELDINVLEYC